VLEDNVLFHTLEGVVAVCFFVLDQVNFSHLALTQLAYDVEVLQIDLSVVDA
jgi:hypothetical protein